MSSGMRELNQLEAIFMQITRKNLQDSNRVKEEIEYKSKKSIESQWNMQKEMLYSAGIELPVECTLDEHTEYFQ